jgi:hypothetical protein
VKALYTKNSKIMMKEFDEYINGKIFCVHEFEE